MKIRHILFKEIRLQISLNNRPKWKKENMTSSNFTRRDFVKTIWLGVTAVVTPSTGNIRSRSLDRFGDLESVRFDSWPNER